MFGKRKKKKKEDKFEALNPAFFEYIQPMGGLTFKEPNYIVTGDGYIRVLHLCTLPKILNDFWLDKIFDIDGSVVTMDVHTKDTAEVKKNINKSLKEEFSRLKTATNYTDIYEADMRKNELQALFDEVSAFGEVIKMIDVRIFVTGRNLIELDERCENIMKNLEGDSYKLATFLNEGKREWQSMFEPYTAQHSKPFCAKSHPLMSEQIAYGDPFRYSELLDPLGSLLGFTRIGGAVLFDEFTKTQSRQHYNSLICGDMGSGKSTLLKKRFKAHAAAGNFLRVFDVTGEFTQLTREFGGKIISCSGSSGILNPLEILRSGDDDYTSYTRHIAKVSVFFRCIVPNLTDGDVITLQNQLKNFYQSLGLVPEPENGKSITGLAASKYPVLSDFRDYLKDGLNELKSKTPESDVELSLIQNEALKMAHLEQIVTNMVETYGYMFNGITSIDNITDERIVTFDISSIKDLGDVFTAQLFNMISLCWDNAVNNGSIMKDLWDKGEIEEKDIIDFLVLIDESHRWVNTKKPMILELLITYFREARKYFAGITLASQSVRDYMPEGLNNPNVDLLKTLFELTQYKFMFKQDSSTTTLLNNIFDNALTYSQIEQIPYLNTGECILSIKGDRSLKFRVWLSDQYERSLFAGGR